MTFLRSNHIKEFTSSYGMHARCPGTLKRSRKLAWQLLLRVLTLFPAGERSQLTQCNMKQQEKATTTGVLIALMRHNDNTEKTGSCVRISLLKPSAKHLPC